MESQHYDLQAEVEDRHWWFVGRRRIVRAVLEHFLPPGRATVVMDYGCGTGASVNDLARDYDCFGVDASRHVIELARQRFPNRRFDHVEETVVCDRPPVDAVLMLDVLEHVADDRALLSRVLQQVKPAGLAIVTVPADATLWSHHDVSLGHFRRYDEQQLAAIWAGLPVRCLFWSYFNSRLYPLIRHIRLRNHRTGRTWGRAETDLSMPPVLINSLLTKLFVGEANRLRNALRSGTGPAYRRGVSLMAVLRRE